MSTTAEQVSQLSAYQLRLPTFEGPLDVLLRMIERSQLDISEVSLVAVTDQFLDYVASLDNVPSELLAEFTAMASRLLALKSRSLLPAPPKTEEEPEPDDLARQLRAYQAVLAAAEHLQARERAGVRAYARPPMPLDGMPVNERIAPVPVPTLLRALRRCLNRTPAKPKTYRPKPVVTLAQMTRRLLGRLQRRTHFTALLGESPTRTEYMVGFIALLSLLRQRLLDAAQPGLFAEIEVWRLPNPSVPEAADD